MNSSYFNTAAGAFLGILFVLMSLSIVSESIYDTAEPETEGFMIEVAESSGEAGAAEEEAAPELIAPLLVSADPAKGESVFKKCAACHTNDSSNANKVGPGLWNIVNRPVAANDGFNYSAAMVEFAEGGSVAWDYEHLSGFLAAPKKYVKGTAMGFAGIKKIDERADLIAYLRTLADSPEPLPAATEVTAVPADEAVEAPADSE